METYQKITFYMLIFFNTLLFVGGIINLIVSKIISGVIIGVIMMALSILFFVLTFRAKKEIEKELKRKCCVCGKKSYCRIGRYSNLVCNGCAEEYKKGSKKLKKIVDTF